MLEPRIEQPDNDEQKGYERHHFDEELGEISENFLPRFETKRKGSQCEDQINEKPNVLFFLQENSNHSTSPTNVPITTAAMKLSTFLTTATDLPKYAISRGRVTTPTIIKVVMKVATTV